MTDEDEKVKEKRGAYNHLRVPVFEFEPGTTLPYTQRAAVFPARWLGLLERQYQHADLRKRRYLPTRSLAEIVGALDPHITSVGSNLTADTWIHATADVDREVLLAAVCAWAEARITPDRPEIDWYALLGDDPIEWREVTCDLARTGLHPNGTVAPSPEMFALLATCLAKTVIDRGGLNLRGHDRAAVLGPVGDNGHRTVVFWPPETVADDDNGEGLWTPKIEFCVNQINGYPKARIHANLTATRFPLQPVHYVPDRGSHQSLTYWLRAESGFLRNPEQPTLLAATAVRRPVQGTWQWVWEPGLSHALARLTHRPYPNPDAVAADPAAYTRGDLTAHIMFAEGVRLTAPKTDEHESDETDKKNPATVDHPAEVGFMPTDHLHAYDQLADAFGELGIRKIDRIERRKANGQVKILKAVDPDASCYAIELWTETHESREALLIAIRDCFGLTQTHHTMPAIPGEHESYTFTGPFTLTVFLREVGTLTAGIPYVTEVKNGRTRRVQSPEHLDRLHQEIAAIRGCDAPRGASHPRIAAISRCRRSRCSGLCTRRLRPFFSSVTYGIPAVSVPTSRKKTLSVNGPVNV